MLENWTGTSLAGFMLQLTPCHTVMPLTENPFCATEKILLAKLVLLCKMCRVWNSRSSCCGSWQCGWHTVWKPHTHTCEDQCRIPGFLHSGTECFSLLTRIASGLWSCRMKPALHSITQTPLLSVRQGVYRQCQLQSVGSSVNVSMNSVEDHMLRVWPWERPVYLTHSPWSPISVPLITNRLFHILLQHSALPYLNENQNKMSWTLKNIT